MIQYIQHLITKIKANLLGRTKLSFALMSKVCVIAAFILFSNAVSGQRKYNSEKKSFQMKEAKDFMREEKSNSKSLRKSSAKEKSVESLIVDLQPSIYVYNGIVKTYGDNPTNLFIDIASLEKINKLQLLSKDIEIVSITIKNNRELNLEIDLSSFAAFDKLKYVYLISKVSATEQEIMSMVSNYDPKYSLLYEIQEESSNN